MDVSLISLLSSAGVAGVVVMLMLTGALVTGREFGKLEKANGELQSALAAERQRNADLLLWTSTGVRALQAVARVAQERHDTPPGGLPVLSEEPLCRFAGGGGASAPWTRRYRMPGQSTPVPQPCWRRPVRAWSARLSGSGSAT